MCILTSVPRNQCALSLKTTMDKLEQLKRQILKPQIKYQSLFKTSRIQKLPETPQELAQTAASPRAFSSQPKQPVQTKKSGEIPLECLFCPNLLNCNHCKSRPIESKTPCPYARKYRAFLESRFWYCMNLCMLK